MSRYIKDTDVYKLVEPSGTAKVHCSQIDELPRADVVEVRHGEWIYHECVASYDGCKSGYSCSVCNAFVDEEIFDTDEFHKDFCGHCGAKMDGERREE